jgi:hypothetical protein
MRKVFEALRGSACLLTWLTLASIAWGTMTG